MTYRFGKSVIDVVLIGVTLVLTTSCGAFFIGGAITPTMTTVQGTISTVQLTTVVNGTGGTVQTTVVTFLRAGTATTIAFCNDQTNQFVLNQIVSVNFTVGQPCATLLVVISIVG